MEVAVAVGVAVAVVLAVAVLDGSRVSDPASLAGWGALEDPDAFREVEEAKEPGDDEWDEVFTSARALTSLLMLVLAVTGDGPMLKMLASREATTNKLINKLFRWRRFRAIAPYGLTYLVE